MALSSAPNPRELDRERRRERKKPRTLTPTVRVKDEIP